MTTATAKKAKLKTTPVIDLGDRLEEVRARAESFLGPMARTFKKRNPKIKQFSDLVLPEAKDIRLSDVIIDRTLQREIYLDHLLQTILDNFKDYLACEIRVFRDPNHPGKFVCWDGQHTALALYIIAVEFLGEDPKNCIVPAAIHPCEEREKIRELFISENRENKAPLTDIDMFYQHVLAVRTDGSKNPVYVEAEKKQQILEKYGYVLCNKHSVNAKSANAITRSIEILKFSPETLEAFFTYYKKKIQVMGVAGIYNKKIDEREIYLVFELLNAWRAEKGKKLSKKQLESLATTAHKYFDSDWSPQGKLAKLTKGAYLHWHKHYFKTLPKSFKMKPEWMLQYVAQQLNRKGTVRTSDEFLYKSNGFKVLGRDCWK